MVELSIVIVIIGLIIAGVTAGQSLVNSSKLSKTVNQLTQFETAYRTFQLQYNGIPGDLINASSFWPGVTSGNGNGLINWHPAMITEHYYGWQHLSKAGLINGTYSGTGIAAAGINQPYSEFGFFGIMSIDNFGGKQTPTFSISNYSSANQYCTWCTSVMKVSEAKAIDSKIDDGVANTGRLYSVDGDNVAANSCSALTSTGGGADYNLTSTIKSCRLFYYFKDPRK